MPSSNPRAEVEAIGRGLRALCSALEPFLASDGEDVSPDECQFIRLMVETLPEQLDHGLSALQVGQIPASQLRAGYREAARDLRLMIAQLPEDVRRSAWGAAEEAGGAGFATIFQDDAATLRRVLSRGSIRTGFEYAIARSRLDEIEGEPGHEASLSASSN